MGRPSKYSEKIANKICQLISTSSFGLHTICSENSDLPSYSTIFEWLSNPKYKQFSDNYVRAREDQADFLADEIIKIADDGSNDLMTIIKGDASYEMENKEVTNRSKLRVDARKWVASKLKPKKYGEKIDLTSGDKPIKPFILELSEVITKAN